LVELFDVFDYVLCIFVLDDVEFDFELLLGCVLEWVDVELDLGDGLWWYC